MHTETNPFENVSAKLIACAVIIACLALGAVGLLLPIIPGLLFLLIAAVVAAKLSPGVDRALRQNETIAGYLDRTDGFLDLPLGKKVQVLGLLCVKMLVDGLTLLVVGVMKLVRLAERA